ncbi:MAG: hypothetical protein RL226_1420 [Bacteroidota bacterium]
MWQAIRDNWKRFGMTERLIAVNVAVFVIIFTVGGIGSLFKITALTDLALSSFYLSVDTRISNLILKPWSIITHMFVHAGIMHLLFNMLMLYFIGRMFSGLFGSKKLLSTYLMGGIAGFLFLFIVSLIFPSVGGPAVGASAAVMAIFIAMATYTPDMEVRLMFFGAIKLKWLALIYILLDYLSLGGGNTGGHLAHLGGALYGFLLMIQMRKGRDLNSPMEKALNRISTWLKPGKMRVVKKPGNQRPVSDDDFNSKKIARQKRVDAILDKISRGGYDSLSRDEKEFLAKYGKDI